MINVADDDIRASSDVQWSALLQGEPAEHAKSVVAEIVSELEGHPLSVEPGLKGDASIALLLAQCRRPTASYRLEGALRQILEHPSTISLFSGISGVAWLLDQFAHRESAEELLSHLDATIWQYLDISQWNERFDLVSGLAGAGVYAATRSSSTDYRLTERILSHFEAAAVADEAGVRWRTSARFLPEARRAAFPHGVVDLGVAHGVPGVIGMLGHFVDAGIERMRSERILRSSIRWLLSTAAHGCPHFGTSISSDSNDFRRLGWCYGDVGVAGILLHASRALEDNDLQLEALGLLRDAAATLATRTVADVSFCHGIAGLAHIFNIAYQQTGDAQMRKEAERWTLALLRLHRPGIGIGGYTFWQLRDNKLERTSNITLFGGVVGVALVLLSAIEHEAPRWPALFAL
jgi:lantibiotic modifying enzyme